MKVWLLIYADEEPYFGGTATTQRTEIYESEMKLLASASYKSNEDGMVLEVDTKNIKSTLFAFLPCMSANQRFRNRFQKEQDKRKDQIYPGVEKLKEARRLEREEALKLQAERRARHAEQIRARKEKEVANVK